MEVLMTMLRRMGVSDETMRAQMAEEGPAGIEDDDEGSVEANRDVEMGDANWPEVHSVSDDEFSEVTGTEVRESQQVESGTMLWIPPSEAQDTDDTYLGGAHRGPERGEEETGGKGRPSGATGGGMEGEIRRVWEAGAEATTGWRKGLGKEHDAPGAWGGCKVVDQEAATQPPIGEGVRERRNDAPPAEKRPHTDGTAGGPGEPDLSNPIEEPRRPRKPVATTRRYETRARHGQQEGAKRRKTQVPPGGGLDA